LATRLRIVRCNQQQAVAALNSDRDEHQVTNPCTADSLLKIMEIKKSDAMNGMPITTPGFATSPSIVTLVVNHKLELH